MICIDTNIFKMYVLHGHMLLSSVPCSEAYVVV